MKKLFIILACGFLMASCYNSRIIVGNISNEEPMVKVCREWNHHFILGLVSTNNTRMNVSDYVGGYENYIVKTRTSFLTGLVGGLTGGIYTPTETVFYVPLKESQNANNNIEVILE